MIEFWAFLVGAAVGLMFMAVMGVGGQQSEWERKRDDIREAYRRGYEKGFEEGRDVERHV